MPKRLLDQVLIIDIEATCWEGPTPPDQENEIIEIGICTLEISSLKRLEKRSILVKPERSQVSPFCTQLTTLTQEQVEQGISFAEACAILEKEYLAKRRAWASYGEYDRSMFESQSRAYGVEYPFGTRHVNIKSWFALVLALRGEVGLATALRILDIPLEGTHHRGHDDAWNIAAIFSELLRRSRQEDPVHKQGDASEPSEQAPTT